jgi:hypothetical protein
MASRARHVHLTSIGMEAPDADSGLCRALLTGAALARTRQPADTGCMSSRDEVVCPSCKTSQRPVRRWHAWRAVSRSISQAGIRCDSRGRGDVADRAVAVGPGQRGERGH